MTDAEAVLLSEKIATIFVRMIIFKNSKHFWRPDVGGNLVALHRAIQLRFGYGFETCLANSPQNVKNQNLAKQRPFYFSHF